MTSRREYFVDFDEETANGASQRLLLDEQQRRLETSSDSEEDDLYLFEEKGLINNEYSYQKKVCFIHAIKLSI
jgi:hypothetical protein